jgi:hypothetical protein
MEKTVQPFRADWRDPKKYPPKSCNDRLRLAWEFLRRNAEYVKHFAQMQMLSEGEYEQGVKKRSRSVLDGLECWPPAKAGEIAVDYHERVTNEAKGKRGRVDVPRNTFINRWALKSPVHPDQNYDPSIVQFDPPSIGLKRHGELQTKSYNLFLYPNEVALRFRLDLSWTQQAAQAKKRFEDEAKKYSATLGDPVRLKSPSGQTLVFLAKKREKEVESDAHYWLRSYDALTQTQLLLGDEKRRRAFESGEAEVIKYLAQEAKAAKLSSSVFERGLVDGWKESASDYINGLKFLTLLTSRNPLALSKDKATRTAERDQMLRDIGKSSLT